MRNKMQEVVAVYFWFKLLLLDDLTLIYAKSELFQNTLGSTSGSVVHFR